ncbi:MAG: class I SAM-dependent RNA methyltransferase [Oligoflexia bacterium]|nr:class I SAM-dependent RNA methyltransferase [Oligoflexia bacterium]
MNEMNVNEASSWSDKTFVATVRNLSNKGLGVVPHPQGMVFFARGTWPGDIAEFKVESLKKRYGFASVVRMITPSSERIALPLKCSYQGYTEGKCGGCPWMIAEYKYQLLYKRHHILHALKRFKIIESDSHTECESECDFLKEIWGPESEYGYRNRMQLKTNGVDIGLVSAGSNVLAPIEDCIILNQHNRELLKKIIKQLPNEEWRPTSRFRWNYLEIDDNVNGVEEIKLNSRRPFLQGNSEQNKKMREWIRHKLEESRTESRTESSTDKLDFFDKVTVELFCGSGNFTEVLSDFGLKKIFAIEVQSDALQVSKQKKLNGVETVGMDLFSRGVWRKLKQEFNEIKNAEIMLINPPREGLDNRDNFFDTFANLKTIIYVSCDADTFSRDSCDFIKHGFKICEIQPLDQFPHTSHVELLSILKRKNEVN